jgi:hypothetical protein
MTYHHRQQQLAYILLETGPGDGKPKYNKGLSRRLKKKGGSTNSGHFEVYAEERKEREKDKGRLSIKGEREDSSDRSRHATCFSRSSPRRL